MNKRQHKDMLYEQVAVSVRQCPAPNAWNYWSCWRKVKNMWVSWQVDSADIKLTSTHLKTLKEARLIQSCREGKYMYYRLAATE